MRILLVNARYHLSSGPEKYLFALRDALVRRGHEVFVLAVATGGASAEGERVRLLPSTMPGGKVLYRDYRKDLTLGSALQTAGRLVFSRRAYVETRRAIRDWGIDTVYGLFLTPLSPSPLLAAVHEGIRVYHRQSDYGLLCARHGMLREGEVCDLCIRTQVAAIRHRCVQGSVVLSAWRVFSMKVHRFLRIYHRISGVICPSKNLADTLRRSGVVGVPIRVIRSFVPDAEIPSDIQLGGRMGLLYVGRLSWEKGVDTLIEAFVRTNLDMPLWIAGAGEKDYETYLHGLAEGDDRIAFLGRVSRQELGRVYDRARFLVVPSVAPENGPNVLMEGQVRGVPAIVSDRPGLLEYSCPDSRVVFRAGSVEGLREALRMAGKMDVGDYEARARQARNWARQVFGEGRHVDELLGAFGE